MLAGGPGTGKTTTVSRLLALLREQHPEWRIALAAPTGKAAARLEEAVRSSTADPPAGGPVAARRAARRRRCTGCSAGGREARSRFRHDQTNRLPYEVVVVDESSMVSLTMMARLLEALRPSTRLVLVGDPDQLASVEAGAVLGDLVDRDDAGPPYASLGRPRTALPGTSEKPPSRSSRRHRLRWCATGSPRCRPTAGSRRTSGIAQLAAAVQEGRGRTRCRAPLSGSPEVEFVEVDDDAHLTAEQLAGVRAEVRAERRQPCTQAAERGDAVAALDSARATPAALRAPPRPRGVQHWSALAARWIAEAHPVVPRADGRYAGEPLLVTTNDYDIGLYNGDTGVVVDDGKRRADRGRSGAAATRSPVPLVRLGAVRSLHAMTVHRSQGSQFARITVLLPPATSPLGTRETLYTAVTRATSHVRVIGSAEAFVAAVGRPAARATGLRERLAISQTSP